jgi:methyl-accepting chemotaxis protein
MFKIAHRLAIAVAIPTILLIGFAGYNVYLAWNTRVESSAMRVRASGVAQASALIQELQRERGASGVVLGSKGGQMRSELTAQRGRTDNKRELASTALAALSAVASGSFKAAISEAQSAIALLDTRRREVDALAISPPVSFQYFADTIAKVLAVTNETVKLSGHGETAAAVAALVSFMQGKEDAGQERAVGAASLAAGKPDMAALFLLQTLAATQNVHFTSFEMIATGIHESGITAQATLPALQNARCTAVIHGHPAQADRHHASPAAAPPLTAAASASGGGWQARLAS